MNRAILSQRISSIQNSIQRLKSILFAMDTTDIQRYPDRYEALSTDAALLAEQIACQLCRLIFATARPRKKEYQLDPFVAALNQYVREHSMRY